MQANIETLAVSNGEAIRHLDLVVVLDDILTSGTSFRAMGSFLRSIGFKGILVNFAFARTYPVDGIRNYVNHESDLMLSGFDRFNQMPRVRPEKAPKTRSGFYITMDDGSYQLTKYCRVLKQACYRKAQSESGAFRAVYDPVVQIEADEGSTITFRNLDEVRRDMKNVTYRPAVDAVIFDFDQTLLDDPIRKPSFEECIAQGQRCVEIPYQPYDGVREFANYHLAYAVVSNRPERQLMRILCFRELEEALYPDRYKPKEPEAKQPDPWNVVYHGNDDFDPSKVLIRGDVLPKNFFSFPAEEIDGYTCRYYKPCIHGVNNAVRWLLANFDIDEENPRIVGVGNTLEDIIAYNTAGLESCLALWGVPDYLQAYASNNWDADFVFETMSAFNEWVMHDGLRCGYYR